MISTIEAAALLGAQPKTVRTPIDAGELPAHRVGRVIKVRPEDLEAYLQTNRV